jgi:phosphatidylinositol-3-phosphatase
MKPGEVMFMSSKIVMLCLAALAIVATAAAQEGPVPKGVPKLDHVFIIMMENHGYSQVIGNPNTPFANKLAKTGNTATNYFAIAHPSLNNYLEVAGGSNFGVQSDNNPDWHSSNCLTNLSTGIPNTDNPSSPNVCPIWGVGTDAAVPAIDCSNETQCPPGSNAGELNIDGVRSIAANPHTVGKTIADQLHAFGMSWKSYQESLPASGADGVNFADGFFTDGSNIPGAIAGEKQSLIKLYAAKHNPFVYFRSVQENHLDRIAGFQGANGLFADLESGNVPDYSFIAPNQCTDQHGRGNAGPQCDFDPNDNGTQVGLNPALMSIGDQELSILVRAIHASKVWKEGRAAIVVLWDENDYSVAPSTNQVLAIVDKNYGPHGLKSNVYYNHFSLLKSIESGLRLPCLNHACDASVPVMSDLFVKDKDDSQE